MMLDSLNCPSCHASLDLPENLTQPIVKCPYCSTTVIVPEELRQSQKRAEGSQSYDRGVAEILELIQSGNKIEAIKQYRQLFNVGLKEAKDAVDALEMNMVGAVYMPSTAVQRGSSCLGGLFALVLILGAIGAAAFFFLRPSISTISNIDEAVSLISESVPTQLASVVLNGPELLLPVGDGALADVAYTSRDYNQEAMWVNAFSGTAGQAAWQSEPLNDELGNQLLFADDRHVYYVSENKLMALDRADGRTVWQTTLSDRLPYTCGDCILSFGDRLVVQTLDNKLHGLDATTGEEGWAVSLD
ncbi:MAG: ribosomal protein L7/L12, partial [Candidatus Promineifilaceae bacterium]